MANNPFEGFSFEESPTQANSTVTTGGNPFASFQLEAPEAPTLIAETSVDPMGAATAPNVFPPAPDAAPMPSKYTPEQINSEWLRQYQLHNNPLGQFIAQSFGGFSSSIGATENVLGTAGQKAGEALDPDKSYGFVDFLRKDAAAALTTLGDTFATAGAGIQKIGEWALEMAPPSVRTQELNKTVETAWKENGAAAAVGTAVSNFAAAPGDMMFDFTASAAPYVLALMATGGGSAGAPVATRLAMAAGTMAGADFATQFGTNVKNAQAQGKDFDAAFQQGLIQTATQAGFDAATVPIQLFSPFKSALLNALTRNELTATTSTMGMALGQKLSGQDINVGDLIVNFGFNQVLAAGEQIALARQFGINATEAPDGKIVPKTPLPLYTVEGRTHEVQWAVVSHYLDTQERVKQAAELAQNAMEMQALDTGLVAPLRVNPTPTTGPVRSTLPLADTPLPEGVTREGALRAVAGTAETDIPFGRITITDKGNMSTSAEKKMMPVKGTVEMAWDYGRGALDEAKLKLLELKNNGADPALIAQQENVVHLQTNRTAVAQKSALEIQNAVREMRNAIDPNLGIIITNDARFAPQGEKPLGAARLFELKNGRQGAVLYVDESQFWKKVETAQSNGTVIQHPVLDVPAMRETAWHELTHVLVKRNFDRLPQTMKAQILRMYEDHVAKISQLPVIDAVRELYPTTIAQQMIANMHPMDLGTPFAELLKDRGGGPEAFNYTLSLAEWLANQGAKATVGGYSPLPKSVVDRFAADYKVAYDQLGPSFFTFDGALDNKYEQTMGAMLQRFSADNALSAELARIQSGGRNTKIIRPGSADASLPEIWQRIGMQYERSGKELTQWALDPSLPRAEREAMAKVLRARRMEYSNEVVDTSLLARQFDQALQFERNLEEYQKSLSKIEKFLGVEGSKLRDPLQHKLLDTSDLANTRLLAKVQSYFSSLTKFADMNPDVRPVQDWRRNWNLSAEDRYRELSKAQDLVKRIHAIPRDAQEDVMLYLAHKTLELTDRRAQELAKPGKAPPTGYDLARQGYGLSPEQYSLSLDILQHYRDQMDLMQNVELQNLYALAERTAMPNDRLMTLEKNIKQRYANYARRPYVPLKRFGNYVVTVRAKEGVELPSGAHALDGEVVYSEHFATKAERDKAMVQIGNAYPAKDYRLAGWEIPKSLKAMQDVPVWMLDSLKEELNLTPEQSKQMGDFINGQLSQKSYGKQLMHRQGVSGYSGDLARVVAATSEAFANHYIRLKWKPRVMDNISEMAKLLKSHAEMADDRILPQGLRERDKLAIVHQYMLDHTEYAFGPETDWSMLRNLGFQWHLGFNVKSAMVNLTQIPMMLYPELAMRFGDDAAIKAIGGSIKDLTTHFIQGKGLSADELALRKRLQDANVLQQSLGREMVTLANGSLSERFIGTKGRDVLAQMSHYGGAMFQMTELMNREVSAIATDRLLRAAGVTNPDARYQFVRETMDTTMFNYNRWNRAPVFRGKLKGTLLLFQSFQLNSLYYLLRKNGAALRYGAMMLAAGGAMGLPGAEDISDLIDASNNVVSKVTGKPGVHDSQLALRQAFASMGLNPDLMMHGLGRYGFGIPQMFATLASDDPSQASSVDISRSIGMGQVVPFGLPKLLSDATRGHMSIQDVERQASEQMSGAVGAVIYRGLRALQSNPDTWKRLENLLPTALANVSKAARWSTRGYETDSGGKQIMSFDPNDPTTWWEVGEKALSFNPTPVAVQQEYRQTKIEQDQYWSDSRDSLTRLFRYYYEAGLAQPNPKWDELRKVEEEIIRFNNVAPPGYAIKARTLKTGIKDQMKQEYLEQMGLLSTQGATLPDISNAFDSNNLNQNRPQGQKFYDTR